MAWGKVPLTGQTTRYLNPNLASPEIETWHQQWLFLDQFLEAKQSLSLYCTPNKEDELLLPVFASQVYLNPFLK